MIKKQTWLIIALSVAILVRVGLWVNYPVAQGNDTNTYQHLANSIQNHQGFERYNGTRTPGYPLFLMVTGSESQAYLVQLWLGVLTSMLVYFIAWRLTNTHWLAGVLSLAHSLSLGQIFFEAALLSEAVSAFLFFLWLAGLLILLQHDKSPENKLNTALHWICAFGLGLAGTALAFTRPLFVFIPFLGAFFLLFFLQSSIKIRLGTAVLVVLPALASLALWVNFIHNKFNIWGLDTIGGYHLVTHAASFFELVPDEYAPIREIFLKFRAERIARTGSPANTIWDAIPELMGETKLNYFALSRLMGSISGNLIVNHPFLYFQNLILGWVWFWKVGVFWIPEQVMNVNLRYVLDKIMFAQRMLIFSFNMLFLGGTIALFSSWWRKISGMQAGLYAGLSAILTASIVQAMAEHGDNARYLAPLQTLVIVIVSVWVFNTYKNWKTNRA